MKVNYSWLVVIIQISDDKPTAPLASGYTLGTSFINIRALKDMRPQLMEMKKPVI
jgi:hypothetical protein